ncbi:tRNA adenosine(34) deaminase TadA [Oscillospiraceae bacterium PP1C4]
MNDEDFMSLALELAAQAAAIGEVPVGAVIVCDGEVVGTGFNRRETDKNALAHAELEAINAACKRLGGWRLHKCDLYVTLEPCPMCSGAIVNARIRRLVFGARDAKSGCFGSVSDFNALPFNHKPEVVSGVRAEECAAVLSSFFQKLRSSR